MKTRLSVIFLALCTALTSCSEAPIENPKESYHLVKFLLVNFAPVSN